MSYSSTLRLIDIISKEYDVPLKKWIAEGRTFKYVSDNLDKTRRVRDLRSDNQGKLLHMYSIIAIATRVPHPTLSKTGRAGNLLAFLPAKFLPDTEDVKGITSNLLVIVERVLTKYLPDLAFLHSTVPDHIIHEYTKEMSLKSDVAVVDVLMKNEACHDDMLDIMQQMHGYLGTRIPGDLRVASGGDQMTVERQRGCQREQMDGDTMLECLRLLEPVIEDWHCLASFLSVSIFMHYHFIMNN